MFHDGKPMPIFAGEVYGKYGIKGIPQEYT